jgi:formamidopyrimidine-DNA glycosylase
MQKENFRIKRILKDSNKMPEFAEAYTLSNDLRKYVGLGVLSYDSVGTTRFPKIKKLGILTKVSQYGKVIILDFEENLKVVRLGVHLGMTGRVSSSPLQGEIKVRIEFEDEKVLHFYDTRKFGWVKIWEEPEGLELKENILNRNYQKEIIKKLQNRKTKIFTLLIKQNIARGVGSYLAQESLFHSGVHPAKTMLDKNDSEKIVKALNMIINKAIKLKGATMRDYFTLDGEKGEMQKHFKIYGREGERCYLCNDVVEKLKINGRGVCFCPNCQVLPAL